MKKVFIVHRWSGNPESDWYQSVKNELENKGFEAIVPEMPNTHNPIIEERVNYLASLVGIPDENTYFIGHSIGAQTIMRFLETLPETVKIGGAVFVAGWFNLSDALLTESQEIQDTAKPWIETPIDFAKVENICPKVKVFLSSNEPFGCVEENKKIFEEKLGAEVTVLENKGHFTEDDGITELPEVSDAILSLITIT
jgi:predicted alpha/beta hydrolase family esterase